jgi:hypothetical protein
MLIFFFFFSFSPTSVLKAESKMNKLSGKSENESGEMNEIQFNMQNHQSQSGFMVRSGNQNYRFAGPQNFIHQQPPPISQNSQFASHRSQIMSNSNMNMNMYPNVGQNQMMQQPPPVVSTATHQFVQQDMNVYQQNNNFHGNSQQGNLSRFSSPQQQQQQQHQQGSMGVENNGMMTGSYQQQPRFRQW